MSELKEKIRKFFERSVELARSDAGRNTGLYLLFVVVAFVFWALMSLDNEVQRDFDVPVELQDVPDSLTVIDDFPSSISVGVRAKGSQLLRFMFSSSTPAMKVKFDSNLLKNNRIVVSRAKLDARLRDYFGSGVYITACRPDSLTALFTTLPGKRVPLIINAEVVPDFQSTISGKITASVDSVTVYSSSDLPADFHAVVTEPLVKTGLKDTSRYEVRVTPIAGMRIEPKTVTVTVPVEPLISKKRTIPVEILNKPENTNVILFPSKIEISYLVPMSSYSEDYPMKAYADYNAITPGNSKLSLFLSTPSPQMSNVSLSTDSVEFVIERL